MDPLTHPPTHPLTHPLTHPPTHPPFTHLFLCFISIHRLAYSIAPSSLPHSLTSCLTHPLIPLCPHPLVTCLLHHSLASSCMHAHSVIYMISCHVLADSLRLYKLWVHAGVSGPLEPGRSLGRVWGAPLHGEGGLQQPHGTSCCCSEHSDGRCGQSNQLQQSRSQGDISVR